jgi:hypothetical protein
VADELIVELAVEEAGQIVNQRCRTKSEIVSYLKLTRLLCLSFQLVRCITRDLIQYILIVEVELLAVVTRIC